MKLAWGMVTVARSEIDYLHLSRAGRACGKAMDKALKMRWKPKMSEGAR